MKKPIKILPYNEVDFKFVSDHYDIHLNGTCIYENKLCGFKTDYPEDEDCVELFTEIYSLNFLEKAKCLFEQWCFEKCVGYHWTYKNKSFGKPFYYRNPKWFYKWLFEFYYKIINL